MSALHVTRNSFHNDNHAQNVCTLVLGHQHKTGGVTATEHAKKEYHQNVSAVLPMLTRQNSFVPIVSYRARVLLYQNGATKTEFAETPSPKNALSVEMQVLAIDVSLQQVLEQ